MDLPAAAEQRGVGHDSPHLAALVDFMEVAGWIEEPISRLAREYLPGLVPTPAHSQVCMYTNTPDHDFLVGPPPGRPNLVLLGGFSGHGFKFATIMGEIAADLATEGGTTHPIGGLPSLPVRP